MFSIKHINHCIYFLKVGNMQERNTSACVSCVLTNVDAITERSCTVYQMFLSEFEFQNICLILLSGGHGVGVLILLKASLVASIVFRKVDIHLRRTTVLESLRWCMTDGVIFAFIFQFRLPLHVDSSRPHTAALHLTPARLAMRMLK